MTSRLILLTLVHLLTVLSADAQSEKSRVEIVDMDNTTAVFYADGYASNKRDAIENARITVLRRLLYEGVEGFNDDKPIVAGSGANNIWLRDFFSGKNAPYRIFLGDVELIGDFDNTNTGETHCATYVVVKLDFLLRQAAIQGLTTPAANKSETAPTPAKKSKSKKIFL